MTTELIFNKHNVTMYIQYVNALFLKYLTLEISATIDAQVRL